MWRELTSAAGRSPRGSHPPGFSAGGSSPEGRAAVGGLQQGAGSRRGALLRTRPAAARAGCREPAAVLRLPAALLSQFLWEPGSPRQVCVRERAQDACSAPGDATAQEAKQRPDTSICKQLCARIDVCRNIVVVLSLHPSSLLVYSCLIDAV